MAKVEVEPVRPDYSNMNRTSDKLWEFELFFDRFIKYELDMLSAYGVRANYYISMKITFNDESTGQLKEDRLTRKRDTL